MRVAAEQEAKEEREEWSRMAFLGYQLTAPYRTAPLTFSEYLQKVGLAPLSGSMPEIPEESFAVIKERALARAEAIMQRDTGKLQ